MIEETALVTRIDGGFAELEAQRNSSCGGCGAKSTCGTAALAGVLGKRSLSMRVANTLGLRVGERVVIGLQAEVLTHLSLVAYLLPLAAMIGGAVAAEALVGIWFPLWTEPAAILAGLLGIAGGLVWLRHYTRRLEQDGRYQVVLLRRADEHPISFHLPTSPHS